MKVVILAGGLGTRLAEETDVLPKPMVEIGGRPILWHIMKHYSTFGFKEFIVALGYKGDVIKRYFADYYHLTGDLKIDLSSGVVDVKDQGRSEDWTVHLIETGLKTATGGRIKALRGVIGDETFMMTYGDGVTDIPLDKLVSFHKAQEKIITVSAVRPPARFGSLEIKDGAVTRFSEKTQSDTGWIHGGYMVAEPRLFDYIEDENTGLEYDVLTVLAKMGELAAYSHDGFWMCMDTLRDKTRLQQLWDKGAPPWKIWE